MDNKSNSKSAFSENGFKKSISLITEEIQNLYVSDSIPWIIGYSGGKDSTAIVQLIWNSILKLSPDKRTKNIYVISTDTLVENPIVAQWVKKSLEIMQQKAKEQELPIIPHRLIPEVKDRFWVNLIGKGYPAPRPKFRWCTSRLKISPANSFIKGMEKKNGEAILVLGTRKAESTARSASMSRHENSTRKSLNKHGDFDRVWVYAPVANWSNDDVWQYLMQEKNPWGYNNKELLGMYQGATSDGECPLVVDTNTPSCGDSRFGCYVCTMVNQDKSMKAMIQNDNEKEWMLPLLEIRDKYLSTENDSFNREFWRMDGKLTIMKLSYRPTDNDPFVIFQYDDHGELKINTSGSNEILKFEYYDETRHGNLLDGKHPVIESLNYEDGVWNKCYFKLIHGPYTQDYRALLLQKLLEAQNLINKYAPEEIKFEVISLEDIEAIRREWVISKYEIEDLVPKIYESSMKVPYPYGKLNDNSIFNSEDIELLRSATNKVAGNSKTFFKLVRELIAIELKHQHSSRRAGLPNQLYRAFEFGSFRNELEALNFAVKRKNIQDNSLTRPDSEITYIQNIDLDNKEDIQHAF